MNQDEQNMKPDEEKRKYPSEILCVLPAVQKCQTCAGGLTFPSVPPRPARRVRREGCRQRSRKTEQRPHILTTRHDPQPAIWAPHCRRCVCARTVLHRSKHSPPRRTLLTGKLPPPRVSLLPPFPRGPPTTERGREGARRPSRKWQDEK